MLICWLRKKMSRFNFNDIEISADDSTKEDSDQENSDEVNQIQKIMKIIQTWGLTVQFRNIRKTQETFIFWAWKVPL